MDQINNNSTEEGEVKLTDNCVVLEKEQIQNYIYLASKTYIENVSAQIQEYHMTVDTWMYQPYADPRNAQREKGKVVSIPEFVKLKGFYVLVTTSPKIEGVDPENCPFRLNATPLIVPPDPQLGSTLYYVDMNTGLFRIFWDLPKAHFFKSHLNEEVEISQECRMSIELYENGSLVTLCKQIVKEVDAEVRSQTIAHINKHRFANNALYKPDF